jgi:hypothetical protein
VAGRRVRTAAGVDRYSKPIGQLITQRVSIGRGEDIKPRGRSAAQRFNQDREKIKRARYLLLGMAKVQDQRDRDLIEYASPKARQKSRQERGTVVMPMQQALTVHRRRTGRQRGVAYNPLRGGFTTVSGKTRASAARAKAALKPARSVYVGKRRRED